jgi:hypothetical protein
MKDIRLLKLWVGPARATSTEVKEQDWIFLSSFMKTPPEANREYLIVKIDVERLEVVLKPNLRDATIEDYIVVSRNDMAPEYAFFGRI